MPFLNLLYVARRPCSYGFGSLWLMCNLRAFQGNLTRGICVYLTSQWYQAQGQTYIQRIKKETSLNVTRISNKVLAKITHLNYDLKSLDHNNSTRLKAILFLFLFLYQL